MKTTPLLLKVLALTAAGVCWRMMAAEAGVGPTGGGRYQTPVNQIVMPAGSQVELPGLRPQALALSPDGRLLATSGKTNVLVVISPKSGTVTQYVSLPLGPKEPKPDPVSPLILKPDEELLLSYTGLEFSPDGSRIYLAAVDGTVKVFRVEKGKVSAERSLVLPPADAPRRKTEIPAGLAVSKDGKRLYVALNLSNRLAELDAASGRVLRMWNVGVAPYAVVLSGHTAYVSNWGGRRPEAASVTGPAGQGTRVRVDSRFIASEGSVSVISLAEAGEDKTPASNAPPSILDAEKEIPTGPRCCALALSPNGRWLAAANAGDDTISVIDTKTNSVADIICARQNPADLFGAQPNALAFDPSGKKLFVCNGSQNAVAEIEFSGTGSRMKGLIPVGWFPGAIVCGRGGKNLYVANIKGFSPGRARASDGRIEFNSHQYHGSVSIVPMPSAEVLTALTKTALGNLRYPMLQAAALPPRPGQKPRPVPERVGEPSVFEHVIYVIKENRTYDQVLGDIKTGNGDAELCVFGEKITPNQHALARQFVLLDNTYCSGILSADGHQWTDSALATDYVERSFAAFPRSYPDGMAESEIDALAYSPAGFIWDNVIAHGKTLRDYGEFAIPEVRWKDRTIRREPEFLDCYRDFIDTKGEFEIHTRPAIESLRPYLATNTVGWEPIIPDVFRAEYFIKELGEFEQRGSLPNLSIICLPNDHTSATKPHFPTPAACVADNDLALGRIVEAVSKSKFWQRTCIFAIEDDPQSGWDHVSGYRTTAYIASPYTRRETVVSTLYNQTSLVRTMELILGLPPMNQFDATATPMFDCFTDTPDFSAFTALPANVPLDQMNPEVRAIKNPVQRKNAQVSARLPLNEPDRCPEDVLNRILWQAMKGTGVAYPEWTVRDREDRD